MAGDRRISRPQASSATFCLDSTAGFVSGGVCCPAVGVVSTCFRGADAAAGVRFLTVAGLAASLVGASRFGGGGAEVSTCCSGGVCVAFRGRIGVGVVGLTVFGVAEATVSVWVGAGFSAAVSTRSASRSSPSSFPRTPSRTWSASACCARVSETSSPRRSEVRVLCPATPLHFKAGHCSVILSCFSLTFRLDERRLRKLLLRLHLRRPLPGRLLLCISR